MTTEARKKHIAGYADRQTAEIEQNSMSPSYRKFKEGEHRGLCDALEMHSTPDAIRERLRLLLDGHNPLAFEPAFIKGQIMGLRTALDFMGVHYAK